MVGEDDLPVEGHAAIDEVVHAAHGLLDRGARVRPVACVVRRWSEDDEDEVRMR